MDAVQESAYKAMVKCGHLKNPDAVSSWVYRIVVNTSLRALAPQGQAPSSPLRAGGRSVPRTAG